MKGGGSKMRVFSFVIQTELDVEKLQELVHTVSCFESDTLLSIKRKNSRYEKYSWPMYGDALFR
ncbi:hypothetical protein GCM10020331_066080 [Ectobacillus funiculus]